METTLFHTEPVLHAALAYRDDHTAAHCTRTGGVAIALARALGMTGHQLMLVGIVARLHDVGKIGIPDAILRKPGALDPAEMAVMKTHSQIGESIIRADSELPWRDEIAPIIRHHHEHYDGGGYPDGLAGQAIPVASRIVAVADSYDAMTELRPYRGRRCHQEIMTILHGGRGNRHDPHIVDLALSMNEQWFVGSHAH